MSTIYPLDEEERRRLINVRTNITKALKLSTITVLLAKDIDEYEIENEHLTSLLLTRWAMFNAKITVKVQNELQKYTDAINTIRSNQENLLRKVDSMTAEDCPLDDDFDLEEKVHEPINVPRPATSTFAAKSTRVDFNPHFGNVSAIRHPLKDQHNHSLIDLDFTIFEEPLRSPSPALSQSSGFSLSRDPDFLALSRQVADLAQSLQSMATAMSTRNAYPSPVNDVPSPSHSMVSNNPFTSNHSSLFNPSPIKEHQTVCKEIQTDSSQMASDKKSSLKAVDKIPKFKGGISEWTTFAKSTRRSLIDNPHVDQEYARLAFLGALEQSPTLYRRVSHMYNQDLPLESIWNLLNDEFSKQERVELDLLTLVEKLPKIKEFGDQDNTSAVYMGVVEVHSRWQGVSNPSQHIMLQIINAVSDKCYEHLRQEVFRCQNFDELSKLLEGEWSRCLNFRIYHPNVVKSKEVHGQVLAVVDGGNSLPKDQIVSSRHSDSRNDVNKKRPITGRAYCYWCYKEGHWTDRCNCSYADSFKVTRIISKGLCWNCLRPGHQKIEDCPTAVFNCAICHGEHKTVIHNVWMEYKRMRKEILDEGTNETAVKKVSAITGKRQVSFQDLKPSGVITILQESCDVLGDTGSDVTIISGDVVQKCSRREVPPKILAPYESEPFTIHEEVSLPIDCEDGSVYMLNALVKRSTGPNFLIIGVDYLSSLNLPAMELPFATLQIGPKDARETYQQMCSISELVDPSELHDEPEDHFGEIEVSAKNNRFVARLPFLNQRRPTDNYELASIALEQSLKHMEPEVRQAYQEQLYEYTKNGYAIKVEDRQGNFLPHFAVYRDSATTSMRIVFDGSRGRNAINKQMYKGVTDLNLEQNLIRFRRGDFALIIDIAKAFLQIEIAEDDQRYLRFLWKNQDGEIEIFQFIVLPFGIVCSPSILGKCLKLLLKSLSEETRKLFEGAIYMDDCLLMSDDASLLLKALEEAIPAFKKFGFDIHKFATNVESIREKHDVLPGNEQKVLGIKWNIESNTIGIRVPQITVKKITRRFALHVQGSIYDPLGLVAPVKLKIVRILSQTRSDYDDVLDEEASAEVLRLIEQLPLLSTIQAPRTCPGKTLLGYSDASEEGFGYCFFIANGDHMTFLFGKSKIVPANSERSIPELELAAIYLMIKKMVEILKSLPDIQEIQLASDSTINLHRLDKDINKQKGYAASKLMCILRLATLYKVKFVHIKGTDNPADEFSRCVSIEEFVKNTGRYYRKVPKVSDPFSLLKIYAIRSLTTPDRPFISCLFSEHSFTESLGKVGAFLKSVLIFQRKMTKDQPTTKDQILRFIWKQLKDCLPSEKQIGLPTIEDGEIRKVFTRIEGHLPILFPEDKVLINGLISETHVNLGHAGRDRVLGDIRQEFFIVQLKDRVEKFIENCEYCVRRKQRAIDQPMGYWPKSRTSYLLPFEVVAIDLFGPQEVRPNRKVYGLILVCFTTRAIRLNSVPSLSAKDLATALSTLFCRTNTPRLIYSDNGTNLRKVAKDFATVIGYRDEPLDDSLHWTFSPPEAPWFNSSAERLIGSVKRVMEMVDRKFPSISEFNHMLAHCERIVNSRTLFEVDGEFVTPSKLIERRNTNNFPFEPLKEPVNPADNWLLMKNEYQRFERLWNENYMQILALQPNDKRITKLKVGHKVLVPETSKKRAEWPIGIISNIYPGPDGIVRVVDLILKHKAKPIRRAVKGLVLFEIDTVSKVGGGSVAGRENVVGERLN